MYEPLGHEAHMMLDLQGAGFIGLCSLTKAKAVSGKLVFFEECPCFEFLSPQQVPLEQLLT